VIKPEAAALAAGFAELEAAAGLEAGALTAGLELAGLAWPPQAARVIRQRLATTGLNIRNAWDMGHLLEFPA